MFNFKIPVKQSQLIVTIMQHTSHMSLANRKESQISQQNLSVKQFQEFETWTVCYINLQ